jgi:hypothetical protein
LLQRRTYRIILSQKLPSRDWSDPVLVEWLQREDCRKPADRHNAGSCKIPVHMLQVCRQIYHEAVLKPFIEASFHIVMIDRSCKAQLKRFLATLVPTQARAIAHLRISLLDDQFLSNAFVSQLRGLKHVEIHVETYYSQRTPELQIMPILHLYDLEEGKCFTALRNLGPRSLRLTVMIRYRDRSYTADLLGRILHWMSCLKVGITHTEWWKRRETTAVTEPV